MGADQWLLIIVSINLIGAYLYYRGPYQTFRQQGQGRLMSFGDCTWKSTRKPIFALIALGCIIPLAWGAFVIGQQFYRSYADQRTKTMTTRQRNYKGVCAVQYGSTEIQYELQAIGEAVLKTRTGGAEGDRTPDLLRATQALSRLSYCPDELLCTVSTSVT